jgi:iron complex transport system ATP-binding protein
MTAPVLELRGATVRRGRELPLDDVTLTIRERQHTAIVGPNGSGKSTLIKLLTGEVYPLARADGESSVRVFGRERWNLTELRGMLGIVSSDLAVSFARGSSMGRVSALDAVLSGFFASEVVFLHHRVTAAMRERAAAALERLGVGGMAGRRVDEMSTGELKRVLIARALVHEPRALVLDEPTTGLDLVARAGFMRGIREIARNGTTLVLVTHHLEEVIPEVEQVVLLRAGRVAAAGRTAEVLTSERVSAVYGADLCVVRSADSYELRRS